MLTSSERNFVQLWEEQKSGPKWKFHLLYSFAWSVVSFLVIFFLTKLFTNLWETGGANLIYILIAVSILSGILCSRFMYFNNERRYNKIKDKVMEAYRKREAQKGMMNGDA